MGGGIPDVVCPLTPLSATSTHLPLNVANKRLTDWLNPLHATFTQNTGYPPSSQKLFSLLPSPWIEAQPRFRSGDPDPVGTFRRLRASTNPCAIIAFAASPSAKKASQE